MTINPREDEHSGFGVGEVPKEVVPNGTGIGQCGQRELRLGTAGNYLICGEVGNGVDDGLRQVAEVFVRRDDDVDFSWVRAFYGV